LARRASILLAPDQARSIALEAASPELRASDRLEYGDIEDPEDRAFFVQLSPIIEVHAPNASRHVASSAANRGNAPRVFESGGIAGILFLVVRRARGRDRPRTTRR